MLFNTLSDILAYSNGAGNGARQAEEILADEIHERDIEMLQILQVKVKRVELFERISLSNQTKNREKYLDPLIRLGWVAKEHPSDTHPDQQYFITQSGNKLMILVSKINSP